jgi:osomolarity two-component system response regulator SKN7
LYLYQMLDQISGTMRYGQYAYAPPANAAMHAPGVSSATTQQVSPRTDGSGSRSGGSPAGRQQNSVHFAPPPPPAQNAQAQAAAQAQGQGTADQTLYDGDPMAGFADTPSWLTENTGLPIPMYHRKSSDGLALRLMMDALQQNGGMRFDSQDPLDPTQPDAHGSGHAQMQGSRGVNQPIVQSSPFGTLLIPAESGMHPNAAGAGHRDGATNGNENGTATTGAEASTNPGMFSKQANTDSQGNAIRMRRSTIIKPHWNKAPSILVVEDDVVYRQLSSKFLEKFGCSVETVENASEAIEKMNRTKYDLVLMDIFFGPSMDG